MTAENDALAAVVAERHRQDEKWGEQNHDPAVWLAILTEEVGELAEAVLYDYSGGDERNHTHSESMRAEAVQVAAVAVQFVEYLDRRVIPPAPSSRSECYDDHGDSRTRVPHRHVIPPEQADQ